MGRLARTRAGSKASVGVAEHGNSAVLVTVTRGGELLDRRRKRMLLVKSPGAQAFV